jgi:hypothetical protein
MDAMSATVRKLSLWKFVGLALAVAAVISGGSVKTAQATQCVDPPSLVSSPTTSGTPAIGSTMTGSAGTWACANSYTFSWLLNGGVVRGPINTTATADSYAPQSSGQLVFRVQARNTYGTTTADSAAVTIPPVVQPPPPPVPPPPPPPPPPAVSLSRGFDGTSYFSYYTNRQGTFVISDNCRSNLVGADGQVVTVGPGYIYALYYGGGYGTPLAVARPARGPAVGVGTFVVDIYQGRQNTTAGGVFESVEGSLCRGDPNGAGDPYKPGSGVSDTGSTLTGSGSAASYLWATYSVHLADRIGSVWQVDYSYRFYADYVELWTKATTCPTGLCPVDSSRGGVAVFQKMPKYMMIMNGPANDYGAVNCWTSANTRIMSADQLSNPANSSNGNHCNNNLRDYIQIGGSLSGRLALTVRAKAQTSSQPGGSVLPWEGSGAGLDYLATLGNDANSLVRDDNVVLGHPIDYQCPNYSGSVTNRSWQDSARNWEFFGDDGTNYYTPWNTKGVFFKGWEDGSVADSCHGLYTRMRPREAYANYFKIWFAPDGGVQ